MDSITIVNSDGSDTLTPLTLQPVGAMKGEILLSEGGSPRKVFVCIFGIDRFIAAEEDGRFKFENLAEGNYDVTIIPTLDNYNVFDTANIIVESADTQKPTYEYCIGALISGIREGVRSVGMPVRVSLKYLTPVNVAAVFDTAASAVRLSWNLPDTGELVKHFNVYRKDADEVDAVQINRVPVTDTVFVDTTVSRDLTYEYSVVTVMVRNRGQVKSSPVPVCTDATVRPQPFAFDTMP